MSKIEHPSHYVAGEYECIKVMRAIKLHNSFELGNAFKYLWRVMFHSAGMTENIQKAKYYLELWLENNKDAS